MQILSFDEEDIFKAFLDGFSDFFVKKALRSPIGINDLDEYETEKATFAELAEQNSYFVAKLVTGFTFQEQ